MSANAKKLTLFAFVLMILTSVFGVANIGVGFYRMGYAAIPMFVVGGIIFFLPFIMMMVELGTGFQGQEGGIYTWMEKSVSTKFAFIGIMMWYSSYVVWMFGKCISMWAPLSFALFGRDVTVEPLMLGNVDIGPFILGMVGIAILALLSFIVTRGVSKLSIIASVGGLAVISLNVILIIGGFIAFGINGFHLQEPLTAQSLFVSPNVDYQSVIPFLGFFVFAVFAYGGTEAIAGVADDLQNPKRDLKRGIFLAGAFIIICYVLGFFMVGAAMNYSSFPEEGVTSLTALFLIMQNLGDTITGTVGSSLGEVLKRFAGIGIFLSYIGAFITLAYAPLKQLIEGTPEKFWPESFKKENKAGVRVNAVIVQTLIVATLLFVKSALSLFSPEGAAKLYELVISMTNVGMTIPYLFLIFAWYKYRQNDALPKNIVMIKTSSMVSILFVVSFIAVVFGNVFTIINPFISGDISTGIWTIVGPILFSSLAFIIYQRSLTKEQ